MKCLVFARRTRKEILRDPLTLIFGIGFPVILILLISFIKMSIKDMPNELFSINSFTPGMEVFGISFISLFLGMLVSSDRNSSFLIRVFASPLKSRDYIVGYSIWLIPIAMLQATVCIITALLLGLDFNINILFSIIFIIPVAVLFISIGLLLGIVFTYKQVGGIASVIVNVCAWFSGIWFDLDLIGGAFKEICYMLPFSHAVDIIKEAFNGNYNLIFEHIIWVMCYSIIFFAISVFLFKKKMR